MTVGVFPQNTRMGLLQQVTYVSHAEMASMLAKISYMNRTGVSIVRMENIPSLMDTLSIQFQEILHAKIVTAPSQQEKGVQR